MNEHDRIIHAIGQVPEKKLRLVELVAELWGEDGPDWGKIHDQQPAVNLASAELETYTRATQRATQSLRELPAR